jgi:hypothetical protein
MYFFTFLSQPKAGNDSYGQYGGAYVNCWLNSEKHEEAEEIARQCIDRFGWTVEAGHHFYMANADLSGGVLLPHSRYCNLSIPSVKSAVSESRLEMSTAWPFLRTADTLSPGAATKRCAYGVCQSGRQGDKVL